ncbi:MAG: KUP/HAK/KT family potassium transporter, partial [Rickettsiales bacterium]|nr:KUP/HAK/KT family potassium transporter [Rickettsiales bacterium]
MTRQATQLNLLPRFHIRFTSAAHAGQIYMPKVNWLLLGGVLLLIALFRSSENLASAYGIAVTGTMIITALLLYVVMRHCWGWNRALAIAIVAPLLLIDTVFFGANLTKLFHGGYMPLVLSAFMVLLMTTWRRGTEELFRQTHMHHYTLDVMVKEMSHHQPKRVTGTAVYLTSDSDYAPSALLQNLKHNQILHDENVLLTLRFEECPYVQNENRLRISRIDQDFSRVFLHFGYMESPNITKSLALLRENGMKLDLMSTTFFISRRIIVPSAKFGMPLWRDRIFIAMYESASDAADYFHIPSSRVVELGTQMTV